MHKNAFLINFIPNKTIVIPSSNTFLLWRDYFYKNTSLLLILFFSLITISASGQNTSFEITFQPKYKSQTIVIEEANLSYKEQPLSIDNFKFYLTNFEFSLDNEVVWIEKESYHLLDLEYPKSMNLAFDIPENIKFNQVNFNIGTDSLTNIAGVMGGDLDPTKGMYWAWNSGYINFKLEGTSPYCETRKNRFQFHLGGYQTPFETVQMISMMFSKKGKKCKKDKFTIDIQVDEFLEKVDLKEENEIMMPSEQAASLAVEASRIFVISKK